MKSQERELAEKIQALTGHSLILINLWANRYVEMGVCKTRLEALQYMDATDEE